MNRVDLMEEFGIIIARNVNDAKSDQYWKEAYRCARAHYTEKIVIVDTGSNPNFLKEDIELVNAEVLRSEFENGRAMLLAYYYLVKKNLFKKAVVIHDSVFLQQRILFEQINTIMFLWEFAHAWDYVPAEIHMIQQLNHSDELLEFYHKKHLWKGCFGSMSVVERDFLEMLDAKYNLFGLLDTFNTRFHTEALERIYACLCTYEKRDLAKVSAILGDIHSYQPWGISFDDYKNAQTLLPIIKIFGGRPGLLPA